MKAPWFTYFLLSPSKGAWKIGRTRDIAQRMAALMRMHGGSLCAMFRDRDWSEKECHVQFSALRLGGEWFSDVPAIREWLLETHKENLLPAELPTTQSVRQFARDNKLRRDDFELRDVRPVDWLTAEGLSQALGGAPSAVRIKLLAKQVKIPHFRISSHFVRFDLAASREALIQLGELKAA